MIRADLGNAIFWAKWIEKDEAWLEKAFDDALKQPSKNPEYEPQYLFNLSIDTFRLITRKYSAGSSIRLLLDHIPVLLETWEHSNRLSDEICKQHHLTSCRDWDFSLSNLNHYNWCFWLVGLALALDIPDEHWKRLISLIDDEAQDVLLDRVIASRSPDWRIGNRLLHPQPYARLLRSVDAPKAEQPQALRDFVDHWYAELKRPPPANPRAPTIEPFWYSYGDSAIHPLETGSYFGRWCIEAVAAVKAFGIDDSLCLGHEHYPGDLLRPDGPSTHAARVDAPAVWWRRLWTALR
jgi:hypothetical protein